MKNNLKTLFLGAVIALGVGIFGISSSFDVNESSVMESTALMSGHLTLKVTDDAGNIKQYRQFDNAVMNVADNCIGEKIFTLTSGNGCDSTANYDFIHIGTGANGTAVFENHVYSGAGDQGLMPITHQNHRQANTIVLTNATGEGGSSTVLTTTFPNVNAAIDEAAIKNLNTTDAGDVLAYQQFSEINLGASDDLTIDWTVTIDGN